MAIVVSDTSPVRALHFLGRLDLLGSLFGDVWVPPAVAEELRRPRRTFAQIEVTGYGIQVAAPRDRDLVARLRKGLDAGEAEALALALELKASIVLIDEAHGRAEAVALGLEPKGVLGILVDAKDRGMVDRVKPLVDRLRKELNFHIAEAVRKQTLRMAGENEES